MGLWLIQIKGTTMNYQNAKLPNGAEKVGSTPSMTEETVVPGILKKHLFYQVPLTPESDSFIEKAERPGEDFV